MSVDRNKIRRSIEERYNHWAIFVTVSVIWLTVLIGGAALIPRLLTQRAWWMFIGAWFVGVLIYGLWLAFREIRERAVQRAIHEHEAAAYDEGQLVISDDGELIDLADYEHKQQERR